MKEQTLENTGHGVNQYNQCLTTTTYGFNSKTFGTQLYYWLKANRPNFDLKCYSEVTALNYDQKTGQVTHVKILGKQGEGIKCDAVVVCAGAATQSLLKTLLGVRTPILPLKTYTFDIPCEHKDFALIFDIENFTAVSHDDNLVRVQMGGDLVGYDTSYDKKRIRNCLNRVAKTLDVSTVMKH